MKKISSDGLVHKTCTSARVYTILVRYLYGMHRFERDYNNCAENVVRRGVKYKNSRLSPFENR